MPISDHQPASNVERTLPFRCWLLGQLLAPFAALWSRAQEQRILHFGEPLPTSAHPAARWLGLDPASVSILALPEIPHPLAPWLGGLIAPFSSLRDISGMTLGSGILIRDDCRYDLALLQHELVHVAQNRRLGSHRAFMARYLAECFAWGYHQAPLEREAYNFQTPH